jgi:hypothetical protein
MNPDELRALVCSGRWTLAYAQAWMTKRWP